MIISNVFYNALIFGVTTLTFVESTSMRTKYLTDKPQSSSGDSQYDVEARFALEKMAQEFYFGARDNSSEEWQRGTGRFVNKERLDIAEESKNLMPIVVWQEKADEKTKMDEEESNMAEDKPKIAKEKNKMVEDKPKRNEEKPSMAERKSKIAEDKSKTAKEKTKMVKEKPKTVKGVNLKSPAMWQEEAMKFLAEEEPKMAEEKPKTVKGVNLKSPAMWQEEAMKFLAEEEPKMAEEKPKTVKGVNLKSPEMWQEEAMKFLAEEEPKMAEEKPKTVKGVNLKSPEMWQEEAMRFLAEEEPKMAEEANLKALAAWNYAARMTKKNKDKMDAANARSSTYERVQHERVNLFPRSIMSDPDLRRKLKKMSSLGISALPDEQLLRFNDILVEMQDIYVSGKGCSYTEPTQCNQTLADLDGVLASSQNPEELKHAWLEWHRVSGQRMRSLYAEYVELSNMGARLNNYTDASAQWLSLYESPEVQDIPKEVARLWKQLRPLYLQLHAYVRRKLYLKYGVSIVDPRRGIPAHLLGNMWGQIWDNLLNISQPFPDTPSPKVTEALKQQGFTSRKMFQVAEEFFVSLNLSAMPPLFWRNSILEKPAKRRRVNCHSSAWDFMDRKDFRILQCSDVSLRSFLTAHHEMGHIENFVLYKDQPPTYREGANPGFDEAIGDVITLSVMSPKHLKKIGLLSDEEHVESYESNINHLFSVALRKLTLLPFAHVIDLWRWAMFQGSVTPRNYNCHWWYLREKYQGVVPPEKRSEEQFDPGSKFHVAANVPYIRYFISAILEFQMHRHMCEVVGEYDPHDTRKPLHSCDIYQKQQAGTLLRRVMSMGSSQPWPEALKVITGSRCMDASALREYLLPLEHWLTVENEKTGELIGWEHTGEDRATSGGSGMTVAFIIFAVATFLHLWESQCWQLLTAAWSALRPNESVSPSLRHLVHTVEVQMLDRLTGSKNCSHLVMDQDAIN